MASNIGMMDSAYFVGRNELLSWINARLHLTFSRIEEVTTNFFLSLEDLLSFFFYIAMVELE